MYRFDGYESEDYRDEDGISQDKVLKIHEWLEHALEHVDPENEETISALNKISDIVGFYKPVRRI